MTLNMRRLFGPASFWMLHDINLPFIDVVIITLDLENCSHTIESSYCKYQIIDYLNVRKTGEVETAFV